MSVKKKNIGSLVLIGTVFLFLIMVGACKKGAVGILEAIVLDTGQSSWNLSTSNGSELLDIFLVGDGVDKIVLDSIRMRGDNPSASPLSAVFAALEGSRVRTQFRKKDISNLLLNPSSGSTHNITVEFNTLDSGDTTEVHSTVTVSDAGESADFTLEIDPSEWSLNYPNSSGTVEAFIRGEGIANIDLNSIELTGDNLSAAAIPADSVSINNNQIHARFPKNQVIGLLQDPAEGTFHTVTVSFLETGGTERKPLTAEISIEDEDGIVPGELELEIDPDEWDLNFTNSNGTVEAFIKGEGIANIDLSSIEMSGDNTLAMPLPALSASITGDHIHAKFPKNQVIGLLLNPEDGSVHTITVSFLETGGTERLELTAEIIVEDEDAIVPEELELEIDPEEWNLNFTGSNGTVEAFIEGDGIEDIDLSTILMSGDNPAAAPLAASSVTIKGDHIHAKFPKNQVIGLLLNPEEGSVHTITISFYTVGGTELIELTAQITIEEDDDGEEEPSDLSLQLAPDSWNTNYATGSGSVKAFIRGDGIENIDLDSFEMYGDNPAATPLVGTGAALNGNHIQVDFPKNQVLGLLVNPGNGSTHTVTVTFTMGGQAYQLSTEVTVNGKIK